MTGNVVISEVNALCLFRTKEGKKKHMSSGEIVVSADGMTL